MVFSSLGDVSHRAENMSTKSLKLRFPCPSSENVSTILSLNGFSCWKKCQEISAITVIIWLYNQDNRSTLAPHTETPIQDILASLCSVGGNVLPWPSSSDDCVTVVNSKLHPESNIIPACQTKDDEVAVWRAGKWD